MVVTTTLFSSLDSGTSSRVEDERELLLVSLLTFFVITNWDSSANLFLCFRCMKNQNPAKDSIRTAATGTTMAGSNCTSLPSSPLFFGGEVATTVLPVGVAVVMVWLDRALASEALSDEYTAESRTMLGDGVMTVTGTPSDDVVSVTSRVYVVHAIRLSRTSEVALTPADALILPVSSACGVLLSR